MITVEIVAKAQRIVEQNRIESRSLALCKEAGICPECGSRVEERDVFVGRHLTVQYHCGKCGIIRYVRGGITA